MMRSSEALSILGALCVIFGLGIAGYQMIMPEAVSKSTSMRPTAIKHLVPQALRLGGESNSRQRFLVQRAQGGLIILGVGAAMMLAGAVFQRRSG
jgi:uncharacterized membrane protein